ncbi:hypothetical protein GOP47_0024876 [Adiantum capillus-veneris]|uniref:Uncharacterized protein n=1 Tax=Adiantum capillus-veneris TaxID=13818 RepID=A0A9D4U2L2_ADICA|nr:hypothetical protein GOP47_0024876 [Adiantum capillus-veneris]
MCNRLAFARFGVLQIKPIGRKQEQAHALEADTTVGWRLQDCFASRSLSSLRTSTRPFALHGSLQIAMPNSFGCCFFGGRPPVRQDRRGVCPVENDFWL